jgi:hypothetical protein
LLGFWYAKYGEANYFRSIQQRLGLESLASWQGDGVRVAGGKTLNPAELVEVQLVSNANKLLIKRVRFQTFAQNF